MKDLWLSKTPWMVDVLCDYEKGCKFFENDGDSNTHCRWIYRSFVGEKEYKFCGNKDRDSYKNYHQEEVIE